MKAIPVMIVLALISGSAVAQGSGGEVEIDVGQVFLPHHGFDDNDHVEAVIDGELPDPCFTLGPARVEWPAGSADVRIRQFAWRRADGACGTGDLIDEPVPFVNSVSLGRMTAGKYRLLYRAEDEVLGERAFEIAQARVANIDDRDYAPVTHISMDPLQEEDRDIQVTLSGRITSSCTSLVSPVEKRVEEDVVILLPTVQRRAGPCEKTRKDFGITVNLGRMRSGRYLLHVRSMSGKAVYQVFSVLTAPRGR